MIISIGKQKISLVENNPSSSSPLFKTFSITNLLYIHFYRQATYTGRSLATQKKIFAFETKQDLYNTSNSSLSQEFQYIVRMTRVLMDFYVMWAELEDFMVTMSVLTDISGYKAKVEEILIHCLI